MAAAAEPANETVTVSQPRGTTPATAPETAPTAQPQQSTDSLLDLRVIVRALTRRLASVPDLADVAEQIERQSDNPDWSAALSNVADSIAQVVSSLNAERRELEEDEVVLVGQFDRAVFLPFGRHEHERETALRHILAAQFDEPQFIAIKIQ